MKDLLNYYNSSRENKIKVFATGIIIYFVLYLAANPNTYDFYVLRVKAMVNSTISSFRGVESQKISTPDPIIVPTGVAKNQTNY